MTNAPCLGRVETNMALDKKSCAYCAFRYLKDYGYSDYTVEGTEIHCKHDLNPGYPVEDPTTYEVFKEPHTFADGCSSFFEGDALAHFSVEDAVEFEDEK